MLFVWFTKIHFNNFHVQMQDLKVVWGDVLSSICLILLLVAYYFKLLKLHILLNECLWSSKLLNLVVCNVWKVSVLGALECFISSFLIFYVNFEEKKKRKKNLWILSNLIDLLCSRLDSSCLWFLMAPFHFHVNINL